MSKEKQGGRFVSESMVEGGAVRWVVRSSGYAELWVHDCYRAVNLEFDFWTKQQRRTRIKKIDRMISELQKMRNAMEETEV